MIFNQDLLFIHVPKTGGISLTNYLFQVLPRPLYYTSRERLTVSADPRAIWIEGHSHEDLTQAREIVHRCGFELDKFRLILAVIRNPYARELSFYSYLAAWGGRVTPAVELALAADFEGWIDRHYPDARGNVSEEFYKIDGQIPPNMRLLRQEHLSEDLKQALGTIGIDAQGDLPHQNRSEHASFEAYYTAHSEQVLYDHYKWMFDAGWYERLKRPTASALDVLRLELRDMKLVARERAAECDRMSAAGRDLERWAHELERAAQEREATIRACERALGPLLAPLRLAARLKKRL